MSRYHAASAAIRWRASRLWQPGKRSTGAGATRGGIRIAAPPVDFPTEYPLAGETVSGLRVTDDVPNTSSISASMMEYEILDGIREVSMAHFPGRKPFYADKKGRSELAAEIEENGWIDPLIVVIEADAVEKGPYILEGAHRFDALAEMGIESFPALVVLDLDTYGSMPTADPVAPTASRPRRAEMLPNETLVVACVL